MAEPEIWVPPAIQAVAAVGQLYLGVTSRREQQAAEWGKLLIELAELDSAELRRLVEDNPALAELVGTAWEIAARTANEDKRSLLARVAAAALRGDTAPEQVDELQLLVRTVDELDPLHISLLVTIGVKEDGSLRAVAWYDATGLQLPDAGDRIKREEIAARWPGAPDLVDPAIAALERAGLIMELSGFVLPGGAAPFVLLPYGRRFLNYLLVDDRGWPQKPAGAG
jgi:hypothetical protein